MHHFTFGGDHARMGMERGNWFRQHGVSFPLRLDRFQREHGKRSEKLLRDIFPEVCREIQGMSVAAGADYEDFASWLLCMGCCMYNLESNFPAEVRGCTAFACARDGLVIYGRNNDLPPYLKDGCRSELCAPAGGHRFCLTTSSFINGEEGINECGLAAAMTFVMTELKDIRPGFNSCFAVRYLLEKADSAASAANLLMGLPIASNCNILVADPSGQMAVVECTPSFKRIRRPEPAAGGHVICTVNSFTSKEMRPYDAANGNDYQSALRYRVVMDSFQSAAPGDLIDRARRLLRGDFGFMCQYDDELDFETVWSSVFDLRTREIFRAEGDPRREEFLRDGRMCGEEG